jgi:hypothetical protein
MTLKNAALLALIGTLLMTVVLVWNFVSNFINVLRGLVPAVTVFSSLIYAFGCFSVMGSFSCSIGRNPDCCLGTPGRGNRILHNGGARP